MMSYKTTIYIIKTQAGKRQVKYMNLVINEFDTKEESIDFAMKYQYGLQIEVWEGDAFVRIKK